MIMDIWEIGINYLLETCTQIKFKKKKWFVAKLRSLWFGLILGPFCTLHSTCLDIEFWTGNCV